MGEDKIKQTDKHMETVKIKHYEGQAIKLIMKDNTLEASKGLEEREMALRKERAGKLGKSQIPHKQT